MAWASEDWSLIPLTGSQHSPSTPQQAYGTEHDTVQVRIPHRGAGSDELPQREGKTVELIRIIDGGP